MSEPEQIPEVLEFAAVARQFCAFIESIGTYEPLAGRVETARLLCALYSCGIELPHMFDNNAPDAPDLPDGRWKEIFHAIGHLELGYYVEETGEALAKDNSNLPDGGSIGDFNDDVADVYQDIWGGLELYRIGEIAGAVWDWRFHLWAHWGKHALDALRLLHNVHGPA